jgi:hypothetical protein
LFFSKVPSWFHISRGVMVSYFPLDNDFSSTFLGRCGVDLYFSKLWGLQSVFFYKI